MFCGGVWLWWCWCWCVEECGVGLVLGRRGGWRRDEWEKEAWSVVEWGEMCVCVGSEGEAGRRRRPFGQDVVFVCLFFSKKKELLKH